MSQFKAKIDYTQEQDADLIPIGTTIHDGMTAAVATFAAPPVTMANFQTHITDYNDKLGKAQNRGANEVAAKNAARLVLEGDLRNLGHYVNVGSNGDRAKVDLSGFAGYDSRHSRSLDKGLVSNVSFLPANLRLSQGNGSGVIKCQWKATAAEPVAKYKLPPAIRTTTLAGAIKGRSVVANARSADSRLAIPFGRVFARLPGTVKPGRLATRPKSW